MKFTFYNRKEILFHYKIWALKTRRIFKTVERVLKIYVSDRKILFNNVYVKMTTYGGADKSLARLLPDVLCLMVRIFRLILVLFYIYI